MVNIHWKLGLLFLLLASGNLSAFTQEDAKLERAARLGDLAATEYFDAAKNALTEMVRFKTVSDSHTPNHQNPEFIRFKQWLKQHCQRLGLRYEDHQQVILVSIGEGEKKLGLITHADVQPANPAMWKNNPFELDQTQRVDYWIGRGTEDDKGPIAAALYALKTLNDENSKRPKIELLIYLSEESDWDPLREFVKSYSPAPINLAFDSEFPVVTAEKGWGLVKLKFPVLADNLTDQSSINDRPQILTFKGGAFSSQIPQQAIAITRGLTDQQVVELNTQLSRLAHERKIKFEITRVRDKTFFSLEGRSAHSSKPEEGINAVSHLAYVLGSLEWSPSPEATAVHFLGDNIGLSYTAKLFGNVAYQDNFMGPLTVSPTLLEYKQLHLELSINLRRPSGKSRSQLQQDIEKALNDWQNQRQLKIETLGITLSDPYRMDNAPQVADLLKVYGHIMQVKAPQPVSIGGSTNGQLFPNTVGFGPSFPGNEYTGHSEHEFIRANDFRQLLRLYTATLVYLTED